MNDSKSFLEQVWASPENSSLCELMPEPNEKEAERLKSQAREDHLISPETVKGALAYYAIKFIQRHDPSGNRINRDRHVLATDLMNALCNAVNFPDISYSESILIAEQRFASLSRSCEKIAQACSIAAANPGTTSTVSSAHSSTAHRRPPIPPR